MDKAEQERFQKLQSVKFTKFDILCGYEELNSLKEVQIEASLDLALVDKLYKQNPKEYDGVRNLLHNFVWFICHSDGKTEPAMLWEDDVHGISYFKMMQDIRSKFVKE